MNDCVKLIICIILSEKKWMSQTWACNNSKHRSANSKLALCDKRVRHNLSLMMAAAQTWKWWEVSISQYAAMSWSSKSCFSFRSMFVTMDTEGSWTFFKSRRVVKSSSAVKKAAIAWPGSVTNSLGLKVMILNSLSCKFNAFTVAVKRSPLFWPPKMIWQLVGS